MINQGVKASNTLGSIYMNAINYQMQLHFRSIIELKFKQVEGIINRTHPETVKYFDKDTVDDLIESAKIREFTYLALYSTLCRYIIGG